MTITRIFSEKDLASLARIDKDVFINWAQKTSSRHGQIDSIDKLSNLYDRLQLFNVED